MALATAMTLSLAVASFALGLVLAVGGAALKLAPSLALRAIGDAYTTVVRGIPELLVIYLLFFGGSSAAGFVARLFGYEGYVELHAFTIGAVAIGVVSGAYSTEVVRGAFLAVPRGQLEAARACGMGDWLLFRRILVPQVLRYALPGLGNVWQLTLKDTSLISVTGLVEIMRQAFVASGSTREPFTFYLTAALLYLLLTAASSRVFRQAEAWAGRGVRRG